MDSHSLYKQHSEILCDIRNLLYESLKNMQNISQDLSKENTGHLKIFTELLLKILPMEQKVSCFLKEENIPMAFPFVIEEDTKILENYVKRLCRVKNI